MTPDKWKRAEGLFHEALEVPAQERGQWLEAACSGDAELRAEVESLLESDEAAGEGFVAQQIEPLVADLLEEREPAQLEPMQLPPMRVGPYRVVRELGRGGMGTVYLAERDDDEYHTRVAIKLVRRGMDTALILHRFYRERQTLARLQHPNIARLLDGGTTSEGEPYIVMEYVEGERITEYCRERELNTRQRLALFLDVCKAVDYAHRQLVVHRDLKPGNILVDRTGVVKLLDFGICKLLQHQEAEGTATVGMLPAYTPNYASPEQIRAEPITVTSDVYSAGAVLYELLTGVTPHRIRDYTPRAIEKAICEDEIVRPSQAAAGKPWAKQLTGDLDNILMHALEKEAGRRYETVEQLADDIRRFLAHEPVRARAGTLAYRARKFVQRRSGWVAATAAVLLTMSAGVAVSWRSARIANENLGLVRKLSNTFVFDVYDAVKELPGSTAARELIVKTGLEYLDNLSRNAGGDVELQQELAAAYTRIGDVQGYVMSANLGRTDEAMRSYGKALGLWQGVAGADRRRAGLEQVRLLRKMGGVMEYTKAPKEAIARYDEALQRAGELKREYAGDARVGALWAGVTVAKAMVVARQLDFTHARDLYNAALEELEKLEARHSGDTEIDGNIAVALSGRAVCEARLGRLREALATYQKGIERRERQLAQQPSNVTYQRSLMFEYSHAGDVLGNPNLPNLGDRKGAAEAYRKMVELARRMHEADPKDQRGRSDYAIAMSRMTAVLPETAGAEKIRMLRQVIQLLRDVELATPENRMNRADLVYNHNFLGDVLDQQGDRKGAVEAYEEAIRIAGELLPTTQGTVLAATALVHRKLGILYAKRGEREAALRHARRVLELSDPASKAAKQRPAEFQRFFTVRGYSAMGLVHAALAGSPAARAGDAGEARRWLGESLKRYEALSKLPSFSNTYRQEVVTIRKAMEALR